MFPALPAIGAAALKIGNIIGVASMGLDLASKTKDLIFGDKSNDDSNKVVAYSSEILKLNQEIEQLEKDKLMIGYDLFVSMNQSLIFRCAIVDLEKELRGSFFARLKNLFIKPKGFVGDKLNEFIANNAELEKILKEQYVNISVKATQLGVELPKEMSAETRTL